MLIPYKRVVLLGCTGFLGKAIHRVFESQRLVVRGYGSAELDLRRFEMLRLLDGQIDGDTVLIVASALTPDKGTTLEALQDNLLMSLNVGRYLEAHAPGLCVYIGSDAVYPLRANPVTEDSPVDPANLYGLAKYCGERILARQAEMRSSPLLVVRLAPLYGWGDTHMSYGPNQFMRSILKDGTVRLFGQGEEQRDNLYIEDGARLILELIQVEATGIINLATGQSY